MYRGVTHMGRGGSSSLQGRAGCKGQIRGQEQREVSTSADLGRYRPWRNNAVALQIGRVCVARGSSIEFGGNSVVFSCQTITHRPQPLAPGGVIHSRLKISISAQQAIHAIPSTHACTVSIYFEYSCCQRYQNRNCAIIAQLLSRSQR